MRRGNGKVCICAWLIIGGVEYMQAVGCEGGKWKNQQNTGAGKGGGLPSLLASTTSKAYVGNN